MLFLRDILHNITQASITKVRNEPHLMTTTRRRQG
jgi:hypothetical protein